MVWFPSSFPVLAEREREREEDLHYDQLSPVTVVIRVGMNLTAKDIGFESFLDLSKPLKTRVLE